MYMLELYALRKLNILISFSRFSSNSNNYRFVSKSMRVTRSMHIVSSITTMSKISKLFRITGIEVKNI